MAVVTIKNPDLSSNVKTFLSTEYSSGTSLNIDSSVGFSSGDRVVVGEPGLENTEVTDLTVAPPSNTTLTVSALKFSHPRGTPIYQCPWDSYSLEYKTTLAGSWAAYAGMPLSLNYDALSTEYRDANSTSTYYWRYRYYSTKDSSYTAYSDTIQAGGWPRNSVGYMVKEVRKIISDPESKTVKDVEITRYFNKALDKIFSLYDRWWFLFKVGDVIPTVADTGTYSLPSDFGRLHSVLFNFSDTSSNLVYNLKYLPMIEFDYESRDQGSASDDNVRYYTIYPGDASNATGYLYIWPKPTTAGLSMTPRYYKTFTSLDSYGDTTELPIPSMLEDYALAEIFKIRKEESKAEYYDKIFREQVELLKLQQRKQVGGPRHLWKYAGPDAENRLYGSREVSSDVERNW